MRLTNFIGAGVLCLLLGAVLPGYSQEDEKAPQQERPEATKPPERSQEERKGEQQPERRDAKPAQAEEKQAQLEEKQGQQQQKQDQPEGKQAQKQENEAKHEPKDDKQEHGQRGTRIPDDQFPAHFGREHTFHIGQPVIVGGVPRFQNAGYWFVIEQPLPAGWYYTDEFYVDYINGLYYLCDPLHPGVLVTLTIVE